MKHILLRERKIFWIIRIFENKETRDEKYFSGASEIISKNNIDCKMIYS